MIQNKSIIAIITARGGSKGVPKKNIKMLAGKPLICWTIEAAKNSDFIDKVIVSTDSDEIAEISIQNGAEVPFIRPKEFAGDLAKQEDAILHAMNFIEKKFGKYDIIVVLVPTTPLRGSKEIDVCIEDIIINSAKKAIFSVRECDHTPLQSNTLPADNSMKDFINKKYKWLNRQEMPTYYQLSGSVCISEWDVFQKEKTFLHDYTFAYITDNISGLDIDNEVDFDLAELYMKRKLNF